MNENPKPNAGAFHLYNNELDLGDNTVLFELDNLRITILNHNVINFISTHDDMFNKYTYEALQSTLKKSSSLSVNNEKERARFFSQIRYTIKKASRI
jgi:hypothetical protein